MDGLLGELSASQLREWEEYADLEGFGPLQEDFRFGVLCSLTAGAWGGRARRPSDFFPSLRALGRRQTPAEQILVARSLVALSGGVIVEPGKR